MLQCFKTCWSLHFTHASSNPHLPHMLSWFFQAVALTQPAWTLFASYGSLTWDTHTATQRSGAHKPTLQHSITSSWTAANNAHFLVLRKQRRHEGMTITGVNPQVSQRVSLRNWNARSNLSLYPLSLHSGLNAADTFECLLYRELIFWTCMFSNKSNLKEMKYVYYRLVGHHNILHLKMTSSQLSEKILFWCWKNWNFDYKVIFTNSC